MTCNDILVVADFKSGSPHSLVLCVGEKVQILEEFSNGKWEILFFSLSWIDEVNVSDHGNINLFSLWAFRHISNFPKMRRKSVDWTFLARSLSFSSRASCHPMLSFRPIKYSKHLSLKGHAFNSLFSLVK